MEMQLKLAFQPERQCVGWEVWYVHLPSRIVRSGAQFVTPELSPSSSFHSPLRGFSLRPFLHLTWGHLFMAPSTPCLSIFWFWRKKETIFQYSQYKNLTEGLWWDLLESRAHGYTNQHDQSKELLWLANLRSRAHPRSRQTWLTSHPHGGRDSFPKEESLTGTHTRGG